MTGWRGLAWICGALISAAGLFMLRFGAGRLFLFVGVIILVTAALEPIYGRLQPRPREGSWRATGEKFVDPETGKLVSVWFDPASGERRYVDDSETNLPSA